MPPTAFPMLSPEILAHHPASEVVDLPTLIEEQDRLAEEAREVLPYSFDECTYSKGALRQSIFSCIDCGEKGVCYGCSISCHAEHRLVELWTKRSFRCDCPTSSMTPAEAGPSKSKRHCTLNPPHEQPQPPNETNRYTKNFAGKFCRCGRDYDPLTETEVMVNCLACEDWFHESCLNLQPQREAPLDDEEDEEADCLIPSDTYDALICADCVRPHSLLSERAGTSGWMAIVPGEKEGEWTVVGRAESATNGSKRSLEETDLPDAKRTRVEGSSEQDAVSAAVNAEVGATAKPVDSTPATRRKGAGDIFLANGIRERLGRELDEKAIASLPFPLVDEEIYEPPADEEEPETLDAVTERMVSSLPRVQAIEALHGFHAMKDKLKAMLAGHAQSGQSVSREDIETFFQDLRQNK
ncbi:Protein mlo2 [Vanrija pseudolonga]|uniref:Protein mlo2 n=1 Tax=Vanrija pseudolonga TaxID=143232 RepID=A0AAF0YEZ8_9TREE|nr:Protein mlo2 [Vanrija pseudolonga]